MKKEQNLYEQICLEIKELDRKILCLSACFSVISQPEMLDSVNYQLLSLQGRRRVLFEQLRELKTEQSVLEK